MIIPTLLFIFYSYQFNTGSEKEHWKTKRITATIDHYKSANDSLPPPKKWANLKSFYDAYDLNGLFISYNKNKNQYSIYNDSLSNNFVTPASTFNIVTALIALEDGICQNENSIIHWIEYQTADESEKDRATLQFAFQHNIDRAFWTLRKEIGKDRMNYWLQKLKYGNLVLPNQVDSIDGTDNF
jgi:beta-lactamase class D